ncbi:MAG: hypothetical protein WCQ21_23520 [Verrucomicrobiota bacterium]
MRQILNYLALQVHQGMLVLVAIFGPANLAEYQSLANIDFDQFAAGDKPGHEGSGRYG